MSPPEDRNFELPSTFVPSVVSVLPQMAVHDVKLEAAAALQSLTLDRAFEIHVNHAFTILGYRTTLLGKGAGRAPDGIAISPEGQYAIIWDAKVRRDGYRMGTDDRTIREYIVTRCRKLKKLGCVNTYFAIISSSFAREYTELILDLRIATGVSAVCLIEASGLVAMVDGKLRRPLDVDLDQGGYQRILAEGGVISEKRVRELIASLDLDG